MVDHLIVRDTQYPRKKFSVFGVSSVVHETDYFDKSFLENIVGQVPVLDHHVDVIEDPSPVPVDKYSYSILIAWQIDIKQIVVT